MRAFDTFEKEILIHIRYLNDCAQQVTFTALLTNIIKATSIELNHFQKQVFVIFPSESLKLSPDDQVANQALLSGATMKICHEAIKLIMLLEYIENQGIIYSYDGGNNNSELTIVGNIHKEYNAITTSITDTKICNLLIDNVGKKIFPSEGLLEYIAQGFKDEATATLEKNLAIAEVNLEITRQSIAEHKITIEKLEENILESQYLIEDAIYSSKKEMKYSDLALAVAIIAGIAGSIIASVTAYYSFNQIGTHTRSITEKVKPLSNKLTRMDLEFAAIRAKMDNIKITDTIHTRVVNLHE